VRTTTAPRGDDGVVIVEHNEEPAYVAFKCLDPDGHRSEVSWEPSQPR
jgi:hypothetical protein